MISKGGKYLMASNAAIFVRIDSNVKYEAERIMKQLGVTPSSLITMLYHNVILSRGIPFDVHLPVREPIAIGDMTDEEVMELLQEGIDDVKNGRVHSVDEVEKTIKELHGFK